MCLTQSELRKALRLSLNMPAEESNRIFQQARKQDVHTVSFGKYFFEFYFFPVINMSRDANFFPIDTPIDFLQRTFWHNYRTKQSMHTYSSGVTKIQRRPFESVFWSPMFVKNIEVDLFIIPSAPLPYEKCI